MWGGVVKLVNVLRGGLVVGLLAASGLLVFLGSSQSASAAGPVHCADSSLYFPVNGIVGWTYGDPAGLDVDADGHRTAHTGIDIFADEGDGAPVYAPADGVVHRLGGSEAVDIVLPGITNSLTGEQGIELYLTHIRHSLVVGQKFVAGEVIAYQLGDHVHFSVGAFIGFDDREIEQTQDPSPYFGAVLTFNAEVQDRQPASFWCTQPIASTAQALSTSASEAPSPPPAPAQHLYVVQAGDTLGSIAELHGTSIEALLGANGLPDPNVLALGQELVIPGGEAAPPGSPPAPTTQPGEPAVYVVKEGDSLYAIAEQVGVDVGTIVALNGLTDADVLAIGQELRIR